jgi:hypothetical protein
MPGCTSAMADGGRAITTWRCSIANCMRDGWPGRSCRRRLGRKKRWSQRLRAGAAGLISGLSGGSHRRGPRVYARSMRIRLNEKVQVLLSYPLCDHYDITQPVDSLAEGRERFRRSSVHCDMERKMVMKFSIVLLVISQPRNTKTNANANE